MGNALGCNGWSGLGKVSIFFLYELLYGPVRTEPTALDTFSKSRSLTLLGVGKGGLGTEKGGVRQGYDSQKTKFFDT